jgi:vacuolar-type H+-ATPase subunit H
MQPEGSTTTRHAPAESAPNGQGEKSQVEEAKEQAKEKVQEASGQARDRVREQVDQRSTQAGERVASVAQDARSVGEELRRQGKDQPARLADQAADRAERLGSYLQASDADRILRDVEDLGRKQPWAVVAGGLALGFVASRFLKASSQRRYSSQAPARY